MGVASACSLLYMVATWRILDIQFTAREGLTGVMLSALAFLPLVTIDTPGFGLGISLFAWTAFNGHVLADSLIK